MSDKHFVKSECLQRRLFAVSFVCGFLITLFCMSTIAQENPDIEIAPDHAAPTITIDVNNAKQDVDYNEVDRYLENMNPHKVKYAETKQNNVILSQNPITTPAPVVKLNPYMPDELIDLGMKMNRHDGIIKAENIRLASSDINIVPAIPEYVPVPFIAAKPSVIREHGMIHNQFISASSAPSILSVLSRLLFAGAGLIIITLLMMSRLRRTAAAERTAHYTGMLDEPTSLVGNGKIFDFNHLPVSSQKMKMNTSYLNMMWHLGRFSKDSAVNTYFYIAFYIPPHQQYAAVLRRKTAAKKTETNT